MMSTGLNYSYLSFLNDLFKKEFAFVNVNFIASANALHTSFYNKVKLIL